MKKLTILIVTFTMLFMFSCEELERCKICTTHTLGGGINNEVTFEACGKDLRDVDGKETTYKIVIDGSLYNVRITTTCE
jgi:hypothetical protein